MKGDWTGEFRNMWYGSIVRDEMVSCHHKCGECGAVIRHKVPCGPALPPVCPVGIFMLCLQCRPQLNPATLSSLDKVTRGAVLRQEKRFEKLKQQGAH